MEQTLYAEYPTEKPWIRQLEGEKTEQSLDTLAEVWNVSRPTAQLRAQRLREIGFFEQRGSKDEPAYWVPFLYRIGLEMRQGTAEAIGSEEEPSPFGGGPDLFDAAGPDETDVPPEDRPAASRASEDTNRRAGERSEPS